MKVGIVSTGMRKELLFELRGINRSLNTHHRRLDKDLYIVKKNKRYYDLAFARVVGEYEFSFRSQGEVPRRILSLRRRTLNKRIAVRGALSKIVGWWLDGIVDLENPENVIYVHRGKKYHVLSSALLIRGKMFSLRDAKNRPYFHPSSMNARDARMLVNAAGVLRGESVLDPFCGVGGILIEAGLIGAKVLGVDIREDMVKGCRGNLEHYGIKGEVWRDNALDIEEEVDYIITDPPYGRSSTMKGENLYERFLKRARDIVRKRMVIVFPFDASPLLERMGFKIDDALKKRVHSSLTRWVFVCSPSD